MGIEIVKASVVYSKRLSGNAYKVLIAMSLSALDKPKEGRPASLYFGGWDALAISLGYDDAERGSTGHNAVARAIRELRKARHISPMVDARRGYRQSYLVHPGGINTGGKGEQNAHAEGEQSAHARGEQNAHTRVSKMLTPRKDTGSDGELTQDISLTHVPESLTAREDVSREIDPHRFEGSPHAGDCLACDRPYLDRKAHPLRLLRGTA